MGTAGIEIGIYLPQVGFGWQELLDRALLIEELGFHSVWFMDHLYPPEMPLQPSFEGWTLATAVLARTSRLRVGHLVLSSTFRHPALLAEMAASLDVISGGRLELGVGSGSYAPEHERAGISFGSPRERARQLEETLGVLAACLAAEEGSFEGASVRVDRLPVRPRSLQRPRPPLHVGGAGERWTLPLAARYADVWNCPTYALGQLDRKRAALDAECRRIGRDPATLATSLEAVLALAPDRASLGATRELAERRFGGPGWGLGEGGYVGTADEIAAQLGRDRERGVSLVVFFLHDRATAGTLRLLAREILPAII